MKTYLLLFASCFILFSCQTKQSTFEENLPAEGFDIEGSDPQAIMIADKVMTAMGGRHAWDETKLINWTFFDRRNLLWDKHTGDVRIDFLDHDETIILNINSMTGKAINNSKEINDSDSLASYLKKGKSIWINDSYWLVMPFKLKDTGVTLHFIGEDSTQDGRMAHFLQLSFKNVGDTPQNIYNIWVDFESGLISQWAFFSSGEKTEPNFINPWLDYQKYGEILLSGDRGVAKMKNIKVLKDVPEGAFDSFEKLKI